MPRPIERRRVPLEGLQQRGRKPNRYVPLDSPRAATGKPRTPEAVRYMRFVIRSRQQAVADGMDAVGEEYDWDNELRNKWMPNSGIYSPERQYKAGDKK